MNQKSVYQEINEAVLAGEKALYSLEKAKKSLDSAKNWGLWDIFGGNFFTGMMKHSRMNDGVREMEQAKEYLQAFQRELRDVHVPTEFHMEIGSFLTFADFFFDGVVADWLVQSKISDAREQVEDAISRVRQILQDLRRMPEFLENGQGGE